MVHITNTTNTLGNFIVRDDTGSYDNAYNEALIQMERTAAIEAAGKALVAQTLAFTSRVALAAGRSVLGGLETWVESANQAKS